MSTQQQLDFDRVTFSPELAEEARIVGMRSAALSHKEVLELARHAVRMMALNRPDKTATADDAQRFLVAAKLQPLGNSAGSLFKAADWEFTGAWKPSVRVSNHGRFNRVWRLRNA